MKNNIEMIENILNTERRNRRGNREIRFEVNSNYYEAVSKLLSDYKRVLKENEQLRKDIEGWKKYCEEIQEEQTEMSNKNCKLEFEVEKLQKENEELKEYLITQNCEINRLNLAKIRLELSQVPDTTEQYKYLKNEYKMRLERTDFENYKSNYISIQKVKDIIDRIDYDIKKTKEIISNNSNIYTSDRKNDYQIVRLKAMNTKSLDIKKGLQKLLESEE